MMNAMEKKYLKRETERLQAISYLSLTLKNCTEPQIILSEIWVNN